MIRRQRARKAKNKSSDYTILCSLSRNIKMVMSVILLKFNEQINDCYKTDVN